MNRLLELDIQHVWHPFTQAQTAPDPLVVERAQGSKIHTADGQILLDMVSSWWVNLHGHAHPHIAAAIAKQAETLEHVIFAGFTHQPAVKLASELAKVLPAPLSRIFYSDNGSTAVEVALKIALQAWFNRGQPRQRILALSGGYHGDTFGAMSAGRTSGFFDPFKDKLFEVSFLPFPETWEGDTDVHNKEKQALDVLDEILEQHANDLAAFILEPLIQGSIGMRFCRPEFIQEVIRRVRATGALVIFDEVMTGFGRTGQLWAADYLSIAPDLMCLSKGITGGFLPLGVTVCSEALYKEFQSESFTQAFAHGHSYTANPLACAAAVASLELTTTPKTAEAWQRINNKHWHWHKELVEHSHLKQARVLGTIAAVNLRGAGEYGGNISLELRNFFAKRGLLLRPLGDALYLLPPYCVSDNELDVAYQAILEAAETFGKRK